MPLPRDQRPWGIATWMADMFNLSRPSLYAVTDRVRQRLLGETAPLAGQTKAEAVRVSQNRLIRTVLTASLPGKMAIRPLRQLLDEAFDQTRSIGWISELITAAMMAARPVWGRRAKLARIRRALRGSCWGCWGGCCHP